MNLEDLNPKKLRTLRNNLNNRLESFKSGSGDAKALQKSHMLFNKTESECLELLKNVQSELKKRSKI
jgi:hypothetical protein